MKFFHIAIALSALCALAGAATAPATKATAAKKPAPKSAVASKEAPVPTHTTSTAGKAPVKAGIAKKTPVKSASSAANSNLAKGKPLAKGKAAAKRVPAITWRNRQMTPTPERYKEIQRALVDKGYLKSDPSGVWGDDSVEALSRFQADQRLTANGKINAPSLIGLGLGAKSAGAPEAAPLAPGAGGLARPAAGPVTTPGTQQ